MTCLDTEPLATLLIVGDYFILTWLLLSAEPTWLSEFKGLSRVSFQCVPKALRIYLYAGKFHAMLELFVFSLKCELLLDRRVWSILCISYLA